MGLFSTASVSKMSQAMGHPAIADDGAVRWRFQLWEEPVRIVDISCGGATRSCEGEEDGLKADPTQHFCWLLLPNQTGLQHQTGERERRDYTCST